MWRYWIPLAACGLLGACNPYTRFVGQASAGAVDPATFPPAYLGISTTTGGPNTGNMPGTAQILATPGFVAGNEVDYYSFPYTGDSLFSLAQGGALEVPIAYDFDDDTSASAPKCVAPKNYVYDQQRDEVRFDQQGNIFIMLPDAGYSNSVGNVLAPPNGYQPIVADVKVELERPALPGHEGRDQPRQAHGRDGRARSPDQPGPSELAPHGQADGHVLRSRHHRSVDRRTRSGRLLRSHRSGRLGQPGHRSRPAEVGLVPALPARVHRRRHDPDAGDVQVMDATGGVGCSTSRR